MRAVSLSPSLTDILLSVSREDLAGVTLHCPQELTQQRVGAPKLVDFAAIRAIRPDLILADQHENRPEELRELQKEFKVVSFSVLSPEAAAEAASAVGREVNKIKEGQKLAGDIMQAVSAARQKAKESEPLPVLLLLWNTPFLTVNFDTYPSRLLEACGGYNVFHSDPVREIPIEIEDMVDKDPRLLLLASDPYPFKKHNIKRFREYRVFSKIPIELAGGHELSRYGPMTITAIEKFQKTIEKARELTRGLVI